MPDFAYLKSSTQLNKEKVREFFRTANNFFAVLDRDNLISETQIRAALDHISRSREVRVRDDATLLMMFLSGHSQISRATESVGITDNTRKMVVVYKDWDDYHNFLQNFPELLESSEIRLPGDVPELDDTVFSRMAKVEIDLW